MINHFAHCKNQEEAKAIYRKLVFQYHPDRGGKEEDFIELQEQYKEFLNRSTGSSEKSQRIFDEQTEEILNTIIRKVIDKSPGLKSIINGMGLKTEDLNIRNVMRKASKRG